jgi:uncharacterized protein (DUF1697 family)
MALVVLLKGVNVGGHRRLRPSLLAKELKRYDTVNVGAAGTFVVRRTVTQIKLRAEILRRLPFQCDVIICNGGDVRRLVSHDPFGGEVSGSNIVRFVTVVAKKPHQLSTIPLNLPSEGPWCIRILSQQGRFVVGLHRREMKAIGYLGKLEGLLGVPATTRSWNTFLSVARILEI